MDKCSPEWPRLPVFGKIKQISALKPSWEFSWCFSPLQPQTSSLQEQRTASDRGRNADKSHAGGSSLQTPGVPRLCHHQHTWGRRGDTGQRLTCAVQEEVMAGPRRAAHCRGPAAQGECETTACLQVVSKNSTNPLLCAQAPVPRDELHTPGAHTSPTHVGAPVIHCTPGPHTQMVW